MLLSQTMSCQLNITHLLVDGERPSITLRSRRLEALQDLAQLRRDARVRRWSSHVVVAQEDRRQLPLNGHRLRSHGVATQASVSSIGFAGCPHCVPSHLERLAVAQLLIVIKARAAHAVSLLEAGVIWVHVRVCLHVRLEKRRQLCYLQKVSAKVPRNGRLSAFDVIE